MLREQLEAVRRSTEGTAATRARAVAYVAGVLARFDAPPVDESDVLDGYRESERFDLGQLDGEQLAQLQALLQEAEAR